MAKKIAKKLFVGQATDSPKGIKSKNHFKKCANKIIGANLTTVFRKLSNPSFDNVMLNLNYQQYVERFELENERMMEKSF